MPLPTDGLLILTRAECRELLHSSEIGRVILSVSALPAAFPVNYRLVGDAIMFLTSPGTKLTAALNGNVIGFEVDEINRDQHSGWSVLAVGRSTAVTAAAELEQSPVSELRSWTGPHATHLVQLTVTHLSGRRLLSPTGSAQPS